MKRKSIKVPMYIIRFLSVALLLTSQTLLAAEQELHITFDDPEMGSKGETSLTYAELHAFLSALPEEQRRDFLESPDRVSNFISTSLISKGMAETAIKDGALNKKPLAARVYVAALRELALIQQERYVSERTLDDYTAQARELFLSNRSEYVKPATATFDQILLITEDVDPDLVGEKVEAIKTQYGEGRSFEALVSEYSQDPSSAENKGRFRNVEVSRLEPDFAKALSVAPVDELSAIESSYGLHVVLLHRYQPRRQAEFDDVRSKLELAARRSHERRILQSFANSIAAEPLELREGAMENFLSEYGVRWE